MNPMKKPILVLLALLTLIPFAQLLAQAPPATPAKAAVAPAPDLAQFLATLPGAQAQAPGDLLPAPSFLADCGGPCPTGELCCPVCGNPPDDGSSCMACVTPVRGRCPWVV
jgi:hypothetical protein